MLVTPSGPKNSSRFPDASQWSRPLERLGQRREALRVEVLHEVLLDAAAVHDTRGAQRLQAVRREVDEHHAAVVGRPLAADEPGLRHSVDDAREAALGHQDAARELVHPQAVLRALEMDERVVPAERDPALLLHLRVEDVDHRAGGLEECPPRRELLRRRA
jgi:hypothetical protein